MTKPDLPDGWRWARIGEVCDEHVEIRDPRLEPDKPFHYVDITGVDNVAKRIISAKVMPGKDAPSRARQVIRAGDVLVSSTRPNLNAVAQVPATLDNEVCSTGFCVLRGKGELDRDYLFGFVQTSEFVENLTALVRGALYPAVTGRQVRSQYIPLPALSEQKRIAGILNEQMAAVERARAAAEAQLEAAKALPAAYLRAVFNSPDAQRWPRTRLGEIMQLRKEVVHPRDHPKGNATFVGLEHIESGTGIPTGSVEVEMSQLTGRKPRFYKGDIVYGYLRPYLNKVWIADFDGLCSVDQYVYCITETKVDTAFVAWFLRSSVYLERAPIGTTPGQLPRIRTEEVAAVELNLPPVSQQRQIVAILTEQMAGAGKARKALEEQLAEINALPAALLRRAFSGKL